MSKILWIDDKAGAGTKKRLGFDALIYFIEQNKHEVDIKSTGESAITAIKSDTTYDLVILDIIMDSLSIGTEYHQYGGLDALKLLTVTRPRTPIIILSVMPKHLILEEASQRNIDLPESDVKHILRKGGILPMDLADMVEAILSEQSSVSKEKSYGTTSAN